MPPISILLLASLLLVFSQSAGDRLQRALTGAMAGQEGAAVVLDVGSGEILASYRMDVAARRVAAPGSTVKPFTLMALVEAGLVDEETAVFCPLTVRIGERNVDCSHPPTPDPIDAVAALAYSCNHFFSHLSERLPVAALYGAFSRLGLDSLSGRWPTEVPGVVRVPASMDAMQLMSIGADSIRVTPLALAEAYRALALRLRGPATPELRLVLEGLRAAVLSGTGQQAGSGIVEVAGKTGTSEGHAWFAGFAPAGNPEIVAVVFLEQGTGGSDAAPIAGRVFEVYSPAGGRQ